MPQQRSSVAVSTHRSSRRHLDDNFPEYSTLVKDPERVRCLDEGEAIADGGSYSALLVPFEKLSQVLKVRAPGSRTADIP
jgi:hypothetical protein